MNRRPPLLFYCQHSLGMGHLVRSLALVAALAERFRVVLLNGGPRPRRLAIPAGVEVVNLPPLGLAADGRLVSRDGRRTVERACTLRRRIILDTYRDLRPRVLLVELFPFGRKKFAAELWPLLEAAQRARTLVCCSLRDILVGKKSDQQKHDAHAAEMANRYFDAVLVHADPAFARLEESLTAHAALRTPVHYTGFVLPAGAAHAADDDDAPTRRQILVSAGGGLVGAELFRTAIAAHALVRQTDDVKMKIVAGPFSPDADWQALRAAARGQTGLSVKRFVPDLAAEMRRSVASISQCGYNTALDILRAGVPALVVPFAAGGEDEQTKRAARLAARAALRTLAPHELSAPRLAQELHELLRFTPRRVSLDLDGARNTTRIVASLLQAGRAHAGALRPRPSTQEVQL